MSEHTELTELIVPDVESELLPQPATELVSGLVPEMPSTISDGDIHADWLSPSPGDHPDFTLGIHDGKQPRSYLLTEGMYTLGRDVSNAIAIPNRFVSRRHAYLIRVQHRSAGVMGFTYCLVDGNRQGSSSTNGLLVNGVQVATHYLESGDLIQIGPEVRGYFFALVSP